MEVKFFKEKDELYVVARSDGRQQKKIAIRRKKLARLLWTLRGMRKETQPDQPLMRWGGVAKSAAGRASGMVEIKLPLKDQEISAQTFSFRVKKEKLAQAELFDGHYLLRSNLSDLSTPRTSLSLLGQARNWIRPFSMADSSRVFKSSIL